MKMREHFDFEDLRGAGIAAVRPTFPTFGSSRYEDQSKARVYADEVAAYQRVSGDHTLLQKSCEKMVEVGGVAKRAYFARLSELLA